MNCVVCNQNDASTFLESDTKKCNCCNHVFYEGDLSKEKISEIYCSEYFNGEEYLDYELEQKSLKKNFQNRLKTIKKHAKGDKLLELGCAYGYFLELANSDFRVSGIDLSNHAIEKARARGHKKVFQGELLDYNLDENFDVICLYDVIEHLQRPDLYIEKCAELLNANGIITLTTGDIDRFVPKIRGKNWRLYHPPSHLHYFTKKSLTTLLKNKGFRVLDVNYPGNWRSVRQVAEKVLGRNFSWLPGQVYLNMFDIMEVTAVNI